MKPTHLLAASLFTALILACLAAPAAALAGSGTENDPYLVSSQADLEAITDTAYYYYKQTQDIVITDWSPSFNLDALCIFKGQYDGNGYCIDCSGFYGDINNGYNTALFAISSTDSSIKNLKIINLKSYIRNGAILHSRTTKGDLNGGSASNIIIDNCIINGEISPNLIQLNNIENVIVLESSYSTTASSGATRRYGTLYTKSEDSKTFNVKNTIIINSNVNYVYNSNYYGYRIGYGTITNCYAANTLINNAVPTTNIGANQYNGATITATQYNSESWWKSTMLMWDWENVWQWNSETNLPELRNANNQAEPPTISSIYATPATGGQLTEYTLSAIATTEAAGGIASYQWSYSTDSGTTWQAISGATTATYVWTPGTSISGAVLLKCYITGADGGIIDSYEAGYTNIQITVYPPPDISTISVSRPLQKVNTPTTLTATLAESEPATYQWYYSTNGGQTWMPISGATSLTAEYTPATTGTHSVKIVVTNTYGESNELTTNFNVLPTYTPTPITNRSVDISIDSTAKYQGIQQFTLSSELKALNYYTPNIAHLAHDNALYYLDSAEREVIPVSTTTGGTISAAYLGQYTGIITDTAGNTAFYSYQTNDWQYIEQANAQIIANTASYAATVSGGTLRIYNANGNLVATTATTAANLAGNDASNVFVSYSGSTLTYYWINGNSISTATQTVTNAITELHQISGTSNFIISTAKNTVIAEISDTGVYSLVATSNTDTPLIHTQATSINIFIGVAAPNEIFIIGADGETDGTYKTGSTLSDASIAKSTGLFAIAGGADYQAYILSKSESSVWQLAQVVAFGEAIDYSQISTTGTYAAVSTGLKLYLLEAKDTDTSTYYLQGVVIGSTGKPYAGKTISINGDTIRTDTNGMFLYPVQPGKLLIITAGDTTVEYTPSNAALQQIAIRIKAGLLSTEVTYNAEYSAEAQAIIMSYDDSAGKTTAVNWNVYETANNTLVATYTGNSASFPIAPGDVYNNYYVQLSADRGAATVANTWSITPAGGQPVDLYGLDEDGRNIIFGFLLLLLAGLFGVMHSRSGAIIVALGACVMRYLELITIPWILITIAAVLAIVAAIAYGGQNR